MKMLYKNDTAAKFIIHKHYFNKKTQTKNIEQH